MGKKAPQTKRKRDVSPEITSKTRGKRQKTLTLSAKEDGSQSWMRDVQDSGEIMQEHAQAACGIGPLGFKQCCPSKFATKPLAPLDEAVVVEHDVIVLSDSDDEVQLEKWEDPIQLKKLLINRLNEEFKGDPHHFLRQDGKPVGLHNLGATCYANAALQVWNQDSAFRSGVFQCIPSVKDTESLETSPIYQLQVTFAALSNGAMKVFNPRPLIESLRLNSGEQQDAQEFSKLFLSLIAGEFAQQASPALKNLVAEQFEGSLIYGTKCHGCGNKSEQETKFLELVISLKNRATLAECLHELFESEILSGDNKYRCSQCDTLQDATRYLRLRQLPPVLHFSVQRFVFDYESLTRKKSKSLVRYPMEIDMAPWLGVNNDPQADLVVSSDLYELRGVLLHKGTSAYHGHYEAQVFDAAAQKWFQFNDEAVTEIKSLKFDGEKSLSSKECYCLIYSRRDMQPVEVQAPSEQVTGRVKELNEEIKNDCDRYNQSLKESLEQLEDLRRSKSTVYRNWHVKDRKEPFKVVPKEALQTYMDQGLPKAQSTVEAAVKAPELDTPPKEEATEETSIFKHLLCEHGKLHPENGPSIKLIAPDSFDQIISAHPGLFPIEDSYQEICTTCTRGRYEEHRYLEDHRAMVEQLEASLDSDVDEISVEALDQQYWISKAWLKDWKLLKPKMHRLGLQDPSPDDKPYRDHVYCDHDGLVHSTHSRVSILAEGAGILQSLFPDWKPLSRDTAPCVACAMIDDDLQIERQASLKNLEVEKIKLKSLLQANPLTADKKLAVDTPYAVITSAWIRSWKSWINKPHLNSRPAAPDNSSFFCSHSLLSFDPSKPQDLADPRVSLIKSFEWDEIATFYPNSGPLIGLRLEPSTQEVKGSAQVCHDCRTASKTKFGSSSIVVQVLRKEDPVPSTDSYNAAKEKITRHSGFLTFSGEGSRRSRCLRGEEGSIRLVYVPITPSTTVKDIKAEIERKENIHTFYQSLFYNGEELLVPETTVGDLKMEANDLVQLKPLIDATSDALFDDESHLDLTETEDAVTPKKVPPVEGRAFQGTLLVTG